MKSKAPIRLGKSQKRKQASLQTLPMIPDKRYFTIGEVGKLCAVKPHVLRYWEQEFSQLKPIKRRGNRRYYQRDDVLLVRQIKRLLYEEGFTIEGARSQLQINPSLVNQADFVNNAGPANKSAETSVEVKKLIADLEGILQELQTQETAH
jgi:DNA-binding transcriptional MerR regulator